MSAYDQTGLPHMANAMRKRPKSISIPRSFLFIGVATGWRSPSSRIADGIPRVTYCSGHRLKDKAIAILEVEAPAAVPIVELSVVNGPRGTSGGQPSSLHPPQDRRSASST